jgi:hypothetical protein
MHTKSGESGMRVFSFVDLPLFRCIDSCAFPRAVVDAADGSTLVRKHDTGRDDGLRSPADDEASVEVPGVDHARSDS